VLELIEFPADDLDRARRFWQGLLGVELGERRDGEGRGVQTHAPGPALGVHRRGPGPGDRASLPYFAVPDLQRALERVRELGGHVVHPGERWAICRDSEGSPFGLQAQAAAGGRQRRALIESSDASTWGDSLADVYEDWLASASPDTEATVARLAELAAQGPVLELAVGTGRVALPLAARGLEVHGVDGSPRMVAKLRAQPGGQALPVVVGDFADVPVEGCFTLVYVVFNTFFNLTSQDDQVRCFQNVAQHLTEDGLFVIEAQLPPAARLAQGAAVDVWKVEADRLMLGFETTDAASQVSEQLEVWITEDGIRLFPNPGRYVWPSELDLMARIAGLELRERWAGWDREPFTSSSRAHVSVYGKHGRRDAGQRRVRG